MRLWHEELISELPRQQLLGQHRECCALRGNGWGNKYHELIMEEMENRGYNVSKEWFDKNDRGKVCNPHKNLKEVKIKSPIYKEHNKEYYQECIENLAQKDIFL